MEGKLPFIKVFQPINEEGYLNPNIIILQTCDEIVDLNCDHEWLLTSQNERHQKIMSPSWTTFESLSKTPSLNPTKPHINQRHRDLTKVMQNVGHCMATNRGEADD